MSFQQRSSKVNVVRTLPVHRRHTAGRELHRAGCAAYNARRALTLVELLVVIVILTMVTAATIPLMSPATGERKVRESARLLSTMLSQAQARALATGRPAGVWIQRQTEATTSDLGNQSIDLFMCEVPAPYTGEDEQDICRVLADNAPAASSRRGRIATIPRRIPAGLVRIGDEIRFNYRGPWYRIYDVGNGQTRHADGLTLTGLNMKIEPPPARPDLPPATLTSTSATQGYAYQISRQPMKSADEPATLPVGAAIDLTWSGMGGNGFEFGVPGDTSVPAAERRNPLTNFTPNPVNGWPSLYGLPSPVLIMFGPSGNLASVYYSIRFQNTGQLVSVKPITPVYLLVGQTRSETYVWSATNLNNQQNIWVAVNPQSGLVTASEVGIGPSYWLDAGISSPQLIDYQNAIAASRQFARSAQNMGGR